MTVVSPAAVESLLQGVQRYNPANIPALEAHLHLQCKENTYNLDANLTLLKLYQFEPSAQNKECVFLVLSKALMTLPSSDFTLASYLVHHELTEKEDAIRGLCQLHQTLQSCDFPAVWKRVQELCETTALGKKWLTSASGQVRGWHTALRKYIANTLQMAYQSMSVSQAQSYLNVSSEKELLAFLATDMQWTVDVAGGVLQMPRNADNSSKPTVIQENLQFEQLTKILSKAFTH